MEEIFEENGVSLVADGDDMVVNIEENDEIYRFHLGMDDKCKAKIVIDEEQLYISVTDEKTTVIYVVDIPHKLFGVIAPVGNRHMLKPLYPKPGKPVPIDEASMKHITDHLESM